MCPTTWIKHLKCGHLTHAVTICLNDSNPCPVDCPDQNYNRAQLPDFCAPCQGEKCLDCHKNVTEVCNGTSSEHCQCGDYILTRAFRIVFRQLSFAIWSLCCCIGLFLGICGIIPWLPFIMVVEAKAYWERWYFGDKYFVPMNEYRAMTSIVDQSVPSKNNSRGTAPQSG